MRSTEEVLRDHLARRTQGDLDGDIEANYAPDLVVLSKDGVFHGRDGIRCTAGILEQWLPDATFSYDLLQVDGELALLSWSAIARNGAATCHGADTFVVRGGRIVAQTIHYEVR